MPSIGADFMLLLYTFPLRSKVCPELSLPCLPAEASAKVGAKSNGSKGPFYITKLIKNLPRRLTKDESEVTIPGSIKDIA